MSAVGKRLAAGLAVSTPEAERLVRVLAEAIVDAARRGERVLVPGLGVFRAREHRARVVTHAGQHHQVPARRVLTFRAASGVRVLEVEGSNDGP